MGQEERKAAALDLVAVLQGWLTKPVEGEQGLHLSRRDQAGLDRLLEQLQGHIEGITPPD